MPRVKAGDIPCGRNFQVRNVICRDEWLKLLQSKDIPWTRADPQSDSDILNSSLTFANSIFIFSADDMLSGWKYCMKLPTWVNDNSKSGSSTFAGNKQNETAVWNCECNFKNQELVCI